MRTDVADEAHVADRIDAAFRAKAMHGTDKSVSYAVTALSALLCVLSAPLPAQTIAITGGTVYPVSGPRIENGTVLMRDGKIVAVGSDVAIPAEAERIDATGKWVTPGLLNAGSNLGLTLFETGGQEETVERRKSGGITEPEA